MTKNHEKKARLWCIACHLSALVWLVILFAAGFLNQAVYIPFLNILLPLIIWKLKKAQHPLIDIHGKNSLNFQISTTIYLIIWLIILLFMATNCGSSLGDIITRNSQFNRRLIYSLSVVGFPGILILMLQVVCSVSAAIMAALGKQYRYPSTIQFLK